MAPGIERPGTEAATYAQLMPMDADDQSEPTPRPRRSQIVTAVCVALSQVLVLIARTSRGEPPTSGLSIAAALLLLVALTVLAVGWVRHRRARRR